MGSGSSKDKDTSEGQLRSRSRQPDFEEEIIDDDGPSQERIPAGVRPLRRSSSVVSNTNSESEYFSRFHKKQQSAASRGKGQNEPFAEPKQRDPEVDAAIAELEETFKGLDNNPTAAANEDPQSRSHSCGPLTVNNNVEMEGGQSTQGNNNKPKFVPNKGGSVSDVSQNGRVAEGVKRQRHGPEGQTNLYGRRLQPAGLTHLPRGQIIPIDGGANSAPPGVSSTTTRDRSNSADWTYELPKIEGFDIEKFREVNGPKKNVPPISLRLPSEEEDSYLSSSRLKVPSYTKDEMELFAKLEREVY